MSGPKFIDNLPMATAINDDDRIILAQESGITRRARRDDVVTLLAGKSLYVDNDNGDDITGNRGSRRAFKTLSAAKAAAIAGDTISVLPGNYQSADSILKDGVNWFFYPGAKVTQTNSFSTVGLLDDSGSPVTCKVQGYGEFTRNEINTNTGGSNPALVSSSNASSDLLIEGSSFLYSGTVASGNTYVAWNQAAGTLVVKARKSMRNTVAGGTPYALGWLNGQFIVQSPLISSVFHGVLSACSTTPVGSFYVDADEIIAGSAGDDRGACFTVWTTSATDTTATAWIRAATIKNLSTNAGQRAIKSDVTTGANKVYVTCQKVFGSLESAGPGLLYLTAQKWSPMVNGTLSVGTFITVSAGEVRVNVLHLDPGTFTSAGAGAFRTSGGTLRFIDGEYTAGAGISAFNITGGTTWIHNSRIDTSANTSRNPVTISGGTAHLLGCVLTSGSPGVDIAQTGGTVYVTAGKGRTVPDGTFVTSGTIVYATGNPLSILSGTGSPESAVTASVGRLYLRTDGGTSTTLYVKESGTGTTGWVAK